jgi:CheY-like chemotaxis protein
MINEMAQILLVDDDTNVLLTLAIALRRQGHTVTIAQNGWQALNLLRRQQFTVLISDVKMPGMTGVELAERAHHLPDPPRVILTSALEVELAEGVAEAFVPKPVDVAFLNQVLMQESHGDGSPCSQWKSARAA